LDASPLVHRSHLGDIAVVNEVIEKTHTHRSHLGDIAVVNEVIEKTHT